MSQRARPQSSVAPFPVAFSVNHSGQRNTFVSFAYVMYLFFFFSPEHSREKKMLCTSVAVCFVFTVISAFHGKFLVSVRVAQTC